MPEHPGQTYHITAISTEKDLERVLQLPKAIIYIQVSSSPHERASRNVVFDALQAAELHNIPVFKIDCTNHQQDFFENWLILQSHHVHLFYYGGYGETLLVQDGLVTGFINYPAKTGLEKTREAIAEWMNS
jgi:hypothetical protein